MIKLLKDEDQVSSHLLKQNRVCLHEKGISTFHEFFNNLDFSSFLKETHRLGVVEMYHSFVVRTYVKLNLYTYSKHN